MKMKGFLLVAAVGASLVSGSSGELTLSFPSEVSSPSNPLQTTWTQDVLLISHFFGFTNSLSVKVQDSDLKLLNHPAVPRSSSLFGRDKLCVVVESASNLIHLDGEFKTPIGGIQKDNYLEQMEHIETLFPGHIIDMNRVSTKLLDGSVLHETLRKEFGAIAQLFDVGIEEDILFMAEITEFPRLAMTPGSSIVRFKSLDVIASKYGLNSVKFQTAQSLIEKQLIESGVEAKKAVMVLKVPNLNNLPNAKSSSSIVHLFSRAAPPNDENACPTTKAACERTFGNCSFHGTCTEQRDPRGGSGKCWTCLCNLNVWTDDDGKPVEGYASPVHWTGSMCQYQDISTSFQIIFWVSLALILLLTSVIGMMLGIDQGDSFSGNPFEHRSKED